MEMLNTTPSSGGWAPAPSWGSPLAPHTPPLIPTQYWLDVRDVFSTLSG